MIKEIIRCVLVVVFASISIFVPSFAINSEKAVEKATAPLIPLSEISDKPLLTDEQKQEVRQTDSVSIKLGKEYLTINYGAREKLKDYLQ